MPDVELRLLGPVEVRSETGVLIPLRRRQERLALAVLLLEPGRAVPVDRLVDLLWNQKPPPMARAALQTVMSHIRTALRSATDGAADESVRLLARGGGYLLQVRPECVDLHRFNRLVDEARAVQDPSARSARLASALDLWRGPALGDAATGDARERLCSELEESRFAAISDRIDAELDAGRHADVVAELSSLTIEHPLRERLHGQLMMALYRCGRRADALDAFRRARQLLVTELGLEPGPQLRALEASIIADTARTEDLLPVGTRARVVPAQLPPDLASFAGRSEELRRLDALLAENGSATAPSICLVTGTAGVGKTTLAVRWAQRARDRFPDGQMYLNLRGFDPVDPPAGPSETLPVLLQTLQVPAERIPATLEAQVASYRGLLAGRRMLIILDNVRDADQVRPLLPGAPGCAVVITSRNQLASLLVVDGARLLPLDLLSADEARELLAHRLGAERVAAEAGAVDDIIAKCARLPLALAIVAARAATHPAFALAALVGASHDPRVSLDTLDGGDQATRVRAVFSWSYQSLSHGAARLFRLLGLHPGPDIAAPAAASLAGTPIGPARLLLDELARAHLVSENSPGRYGFHDLLRAYAAELAHTHDHGTERHAALHRLFDHYLHTAHAAHRLLTPHRDPVAVGVPVPEVATEPLTDDVQALAWFVAERAVLVAVVAQAAKAGFDTHSWQLAWALTEFFARQGHWHEWAATHRTALQAIHGQTDHLGQAHTHRGLAIAYARLSRHDDAFTHFNRALELFTELDDRTSQGHTHLGVAWLFDRQGRRPQALDHAIQALALYREAGNAAGQANALNAVGWYHAQLGNYEQTLVHCEPAIALHRDSRDRRGEASTWDSLGYAHRHLGHHEQATACGRNAVELYREIGDRYNEADTLIRLGDTRHAVGDHHTAREHWRRALTILHELGHPDAGEARARLG
ncbi:BTAD domain-containing putative transcriptional regulator [Phytohabitans rumicis]